MLKYILRRVAQSLIVLVGVSILAFSVLFLSGDPTYLYVNEHASAEAIAQTRHKLGFDRPVYMQYLDFASRAIRGDFGKSLRYDQPAAKIVLERLPATIELTLVGMFVAVVFAIPIGVIAAAAQLDLRWRYHVVRHGRPVHPGFLVGDYAHPGFRRFVEDIADFWAGADPRASV